MLLRTPRLKIKTLLASESGNYFRLISENRNFLEKTFPITSDIPDERKAKLHIQSYILSEECDLGGLFGIFKDETLIGAIYLDLFEQAHVRKGNLGYFLAKNFQGKGFAFEAIDAFMKYLFGSKKAHRLEAHAAVANKKSISLLERLGFQKEGIAFDYEYIDGRYIDHYTFSFLERSASGSR